MRGEVDEIETSNVALRFKERAQFLYRICLGGIRSARRVSGVLPLPISKIIVRVSNCHHPSVHRFVAQLKQVVGRNCRFLQGPDTDRRSIAMVRRVSFTTFCYL